MMADDRKESRGFCGRLTSAFTPDKSIAPPQGLSKRGLSPDPNGDRSARSTGQQTAYPEHGSSDACLD